jgi:alpha-beta hydrolase superfamily lysophospholipase
MIGAIMPDHVLEVADGIELFVSLTPGPASGPHGTVIIVHGVGEHSGRYSHVTKLLGESGWSVAAYDQRGHGRSSGKRGVLARPAALLEDLSEVVDFVAAKAPGPRRVLLGHSMGGAVAARLVAESISSTPEPWARSVDGLVLSSPALATNLSGWERTKLAVFGLLAPDIQVPNGLSVEKLTHDAVVVKAYRTDPLVHDRVTPRLVRFIESAGQHARSVAARWRVPTLLMWAGADALVPPRGSREFAAASPPALVQAHEFPPLYHEIFNELEPGRSQVFAMLEAWLRRHP